MNAMYVANRPRQIKEWLHSIKRDPGQLFRRKGRSSCTCCGYKGRFVSLRRSERDDDREKRCPNCSSRPRDRLLGYGRDFAEIVASAGFDVETCLLSAEETAIFRTDMNDPIFIARKSVV